MKVIKDIIAFLAVLFILGIALLFALVIQLIGGGFSIKTVRINPKDLEPKRL